MALRSTHGYLTVCLAYRVKHIKQEIMQCIALNLKGKGKGTFSKLLSLFELEKEKKTNMLIITQENNFLYSSHLFSS